MTTVSRVDAWDDSVDYPVYQHSSGFVRVRQLWGQIHLYLKIHKYFFQSIYIWTLGIKSICI